MSLVIMTGQPVASRPDTVSTELHEDGYTQHAGLLELGPETDEHKSSVIMTDQPFASKPEAVSTDIHHEDEVLDENHAITVPFAPFTLQCKCPEVIRGKEPVGCKDYCKKYCDPVRTISDLKSKAFKQAIRQTKVRWAWFSGATALDDELSRRLGTLGYLPFEVRDKIFRLVLDEYIEEALRYQLYLDPMAQPYRSDHPFGVTWLAMKQNFKTEFEIRITPHFSAHKFKDAKLEKVFCLRQKCFGPPPDFVMPLRLATADTKFEFDRVFLSTMTFDFSCPKALELFISELSAVQMSQVKSITIRFHGCNDCLGKSNEGIYYKWGNLCAKLPSTLTLINFDLSGGGPGGCPATSSDLRLENPRLAKQGMQFLHGQVERIALETEVKLIEGLSPYSRMVYRFFGKSPSTVLDSLDVMVREIDVLITNAEAKMREDTEMGRNSTVPSFTFDAPSFPVFEAWLKRNA